MDVDIKLTNRLNIIFKLRNRQKKLVIVLLLRPLKSLHQTVSHENVCNGINWYFLVNITYFNMTLVIATAISI